MGFRARCRKYHLPLANDKTEFFMAHICRMFIVNQELGYAEGIISVNAPNVTTYIVGVIT